MYLFTSSTGVFYPYLKRGVDENTPVLYEPIDPKDGSSTFGADKAKCERQVPCEAFGDSVEWWCVPPTSSVRATRPTDFPTGLSASRAAVKCSPPVMPTTRCKSSTCATSRSS